MNTSRRIKLFPIEELCQKPQNILGTRGLYLPSHLEEPKSKFRNGATVLVKKKIPTPSIVLSVGPGQNTFRVSPIECCSLYDLIFLLHVK